MLATQPSAPPVPYLVQLAGVREVTLIGAADLGYWQDRLRNEDLTPIDMDGEARVQICAAEGRFMGVRFRELSVAVAVRRDGDGDAAFLVHAYNSNRFFAFVERALYRTPYYFGSVHICTSRPALFDVLSPDGRFWAAMSPGLPWQERRPVRCEPDGWEGAIYLPRDPRRGGAGEVFYGKLAGRTLAYPFDEDLDQIHLNPARDGVLRALADSGFAGREWHIREDAVHGKSKTVRRPLS